MIHQFSRTEMIFGREAMERLHNSRVAVFGIGGVGGYVCEALVRSGVGAFDLIDSDTVSLTNLNRQIIALHSTIGKYKVDVMRERMLDINPDVKVRTYRCFFLPENADSFPFDEYDYIVDAVDTVTAKVALIMKAREFNVPVISCMGAGNKLDGSQFRVADIYQTKYDPLAKVMRREMKKRGVRSLKVVYSEEEPVDAAVGRAELSEEKSGGKTEEKTEEKTGPEGGGSFQKAVPGSTAFVPSAAGLLIGGEVIKDLAAGKGSAVAAECPKNDKKEINGD